MALFCVSMTTQAELYSKISSVETLSVSKSCGTSSVSAVSSSEVPLSEDDSPAFLPVGSVPQSPKRRLSVTERRQERKSQTDQGAGPE